MPHPFPEAQVNLRLAPVNRVDQDSRRSGLINSRPCRSTTTSRNIRDHSSEPVLEPFLQVIWRSSRSGKQLDLLGA
jgi:hypothetical protein